MCYFSLEVGCPISFRGIVSFLLSSLLMGVVIAQPARGDAVTPIDASFCADMRERHVLNAHSRVDCGRLRMVKFSYLGFDEKIHDDGEMVVMDAAAPHVLRVFVKLRRLRFPIAKARPMNAYGGDDNASMRDNNSSCFNDRNLTGGALVSLHAYGLAIDINPVQNPFLVRSGEGLTVQPSQGLDYINRLNDRPWKPQRSGMAEVVVRAFADEGFLVWGGYWDDPIDYQHFQVSRKLAEDLAASPPGKAIAKFERMVERFRKCQRSYSSQALPNPGCIIQADPSANLAATMPH